MGKYVREARIPRFDELEISKLPIDTLLATLTRFSDEESSNSQYANAYFAIIALATHNPLQFDPTPTYYKIK